MYDMFFTPYSPRAKGAREIAMHVQATEKLQSLSSGTIKLILHRSAGGTRANPALVARLIAGLKSVLF